MDTRRQVEDWLQHSRRIVEEVLPGLLDERDELMRRALNAEDEVVRLGERNAAVRDELAHAKSEHDALLRRHTEIAENMGRAMAHLTQVFEPMKQMLGAGGP
jgi:predicted  nucleic acid-binding Zn-ribbon protein